MFGGSGFSFVHDGNTGVWRGKPLLAPTLLEDNPAPHEFGHIVGLNDRNTRGVPQKGWELNVMGDWRMPAEQRNIDAILSHALKDYKGQKDFTTRIANKQMDW
jgi:hypothetical protein